ncbi:MAG TPA: hypothetical protein PL045_08465 [Chitinophagaceae bacterium]|nr:hypothetical protein [Chitinophagaceae bacterium]
MNAAEKNVAKHINELLPADASYTDSLKKITEQYPYFATAQYLLAKELHQSKNNNAEEQTQKAALFFTNPFWLQYLLNADDQESEETIFAAGIDEIKTNDDAATVAKEENAIQIEATENISETVEAAAMVSAPTEAAADKPGAIEELILPTNSISAENISKEDYATGEADADDTEPYENALEESSFQNEKMSSMLQHHAAALSQPSDANAELEITATPYHTIDYFASQGIKLEALVKGNDQLTSKVKRFTEWLKDMKRISPTPHDLGTDEETQHLVEEIAEHSNEAKEILTEAMAEVLHKQGKAQKAVELYQKLSFLNPAKSAYFAAKIQQIKGS